VIPRFKPYYDSRELDALFQTEDDVVEKFEEQFAQLVGNKYAISFSHARSALFALISSLQIKKSNILVPSFSCVAIPSVVVATKNAPTFMNISLTDYNIDIDDAISRVTKKTKAAIPIHMYGYPVDIKEFKDKIGNDIMIVEDAALSLLSKNVGRYGDVTIYSLGVYKQLYTFEGGIITTNNSEIYESLIAFRQKHCLLCTTFNSLKMMLDFFSSYLIFNENIYDIFDTWSEYKRENFFNSSLGTYKKQIPKDIYQSFSAFQAKLGLAQLKKVHEINEKRKKIAEFYSATLSDTSGIILPPLINGASYSEYTIRVRDRNTFEKNMRKKGILINTLFSYSVPDLAMFKKYSTGTFHKSLMASQSIVNLPSYPSLQDTPEMLEYIVKSIKECIPPKNSHSERITN
jgi:perosamine synthetase